MTVEVKLANTFYEAEDVRSSDPAKALESFQSIVEMAKGQTLGDESQTTVFKSLQNIVSIFFALKKEQEALKAYKNLLDYFPNVSQNERDGAVDVILNQTTGQPEKLREQLYATTAETLEKMSDKGNMLFSIQMRQCHELAAKNKFKETIKLLEKVHSRCRLQDGRDDQKSKGSELIEIYALRLKIAAKTKDMLKTKELYEKTKDLTAAVKNPKSQSIIKECWGKMFGDQGQWNRAYTEFFNAFTSYQEAGDPESAKQCLKYVVVANMLAKSEHNPMAAREARVYASDPEITPIVQLRAAYDKRDVEAFGKCLKDFYRTADDYIQSHMNSTVDEFQRLTALKILKSYKRIQIAELAQKLQIPLEKTEELLIQLILDGKLGGKIDQVKGILDLSQRGGGADGDKYNSLESWSNFLDSHSKNMTQPSGGRGYNPMMMGW
jgi:COP9 signalosome complex subunit 2